MGKTAVAVSIILIVGTCALAQESDGQSIILRDLKGKQVYVDSLLATGPVVLNFWATWCRPCRLEMPHLQRIHKELESKQVHFAAISLDHKRSKSRVEQYIEKEGVTLPVYSDAEGILGKRFKVLAIPTTVVIDQDGDVHYRTRGYRPGDEVILKKKLEALIADREKRKSAEAGGG
jgi:thiol-disulfide isomerase/thioredoxin